jgi:hypothetical protein
MDNLRKNIILSVLCLIFGIYIISFFVYLIIEMDKPFWEDLPNSLIVFIPKISGILLIYSTYYIIKKKAITKNYSILYWIFSIPLFFYIFLLIWIISQSSPYIFNLIGIISIGLILFSFGFAGILFVYLGYRIFKEENIFF